MSVLQQIYYGYQHCLCLRWILTYNLISILLSYFTTRKTITLATESYLKSMPAECAFCQHGLPQNSHKAYCGSTSNWCAGKKARTFLNISTVIGRPIEAGKPSAVGGMEQWRIGQNGKRWEWDPLSQAWSINTDLHQQYRWHGFDLPHSRCWGLPQGKRMNVILQMTVLQKTKLLCRM